LQLPSSLPSSILAVAVWAADHNVFTDTGARVDRSRLKDEGTAAIPELHRAVWAASYKSERARQLRRLQFEWFEPEFKLERLTEEATNQQQHLDGWPQLHLQQGRFFDAWWWHVDYSNASTDSRSDVQVDDTPVDADERAGYGWFVGNAYLRAQYGAIDRSLC
jgi:hypothetical protein